MSESRLPVPYEVGYGKPPEKTRFQKGRSGNPGGRPRRAKPKAKTVDTGYGAKAAEEFLRLEAYRPVTLREGDQVIELSAIQAVFRAMGISALKGNRFVQKTLAEMVARMEADHHRARLELFETMFEYKRRWDKEIERCRQLGIAEPSPVPHPDDIILNPDNGNVRILGPQTKEQKAQLDQALVRRSEAQDNVSDYAERHKRSRSEEQRAQWLDEWHFEQRIFDIINDMVPGRYKAKLQDRSRAEGASKEGKALAELRRDKAMRREYFE